MAVTSITERAQAKPRFAEVFGIRDWRTVWFAQLLSIAGDQFARVAILVLVYDRTGSALLAALTVAASVVPVFVGGLTLAWVADRYPRRTVMIVCDLISLTLVLTMTIPGMPLGALVALLFAVTLVFSPFMAARATTNRDILGPRLFPLGNAITLTTYQVAQLAGFALGGVLFGLAGARSALLIDAGTFAASALLLTFWLTPRPAPEQEAADASPGSARDGRFSGVRIVFGNPAARIAALLAFLVTFFVVPEGVPAPLARQLGGGAATIGLILASGAAGAAAGYLIFGRLLSASTQKRLTPALAVGACTFLIPFALRPGLPVAMALLGASGFCASYIVATNPVFFTAIPNQHRGKAGGVVDAGMFAGQAGIVVIGGALAGWLGAYHTIAVVGAIGAIVATVLGYAWIRLLWAGKI